MAYQGQPPPHQYQGWNYRWTGSDGYTYWWQNDQIMYDPNSGPQNDQNKNNDTNNNSNGPSGNGPGGGGGPNYFLTDVFGNHYSKAAFDSYLAQVKHLGAIYGVPVAESLARTMLKQGIDASEAQHRFQEIQAVEQTKWNRAILQQILDARGIKIDVTTFEGARKFILGSPEGQAQRVWDEFATSAAAREAGFSIEGIGNAPNRNQDLRLSRNDILAFEKAQGLPPGTVDIGQENQILQQAAQAVVKTLPGSRYKGYGLTKADVLKVAAGIGTADANMKLQRIVNEEQALENFRGANPNWANIRNQQGNQMANQRTQPVSAQ